MIHYLEGYFTILSIQTISFSRGHPENHYVARLKHYLHLVPMIFKPHRKCHAPQKYINALRKMSSTARRFSYIASWYSCLAKNHASQEDIHASLKISCTTIRYLCITQNHASWDNIHASQKIMHCGLIFMPRKKSCITGRYSCLVENVIHHEKILMHCSKSCIAI